MQQQQLVRTSNGKTVLGSTWSGGTLSLEAVHLGRRCPIALCFNDGDDDISVASPSRSAVRSSGSTCTLGSTGSTGSTESFGYTEPEPGPQQPNEPGDVVDGNDVGGSTGSIGSAGSTGSREIEGLRSEDVGEVESSAGGHGGELEGLQPVTLKVDLWGGGSTYVGGPAASSAGGGAEEDEVSPGMLRINVWCSWKPRPSSSPEPHQSMSRVDAAAAVGPLDDEGVTETRPHVTEAAAAAAAAGAGDNDDDNVTQAMYGVIKRRGNGEYDPPSIVSLPDILMASEQVVLLPSQWATGALDLSLALKEESAMVVGEDLMSGGIDLDFDMRSGHRSRALADVGLVVEAVFGVEEWQQQGTAAAGEPRQQGTVLADWDEEILWGEARPPSQTECPTR